MSATRKRKNKECSTWSASYPYEVDYNDHFETPLRAYQDIQFLFKFASSEPNDYEKHDAIIKSSPHVIYDPYYCNGRTIKQFQMLGYKHTTHTSSQTTNPNQHENIILHEKRDFYQDIQTKSIPAFDIFVTNPPYSLNHKERCVEFAMQQLTTFGKCFFLLMPNYVANKDYFRRFIKVPPSTQHTDPDSTPQILYFIPNTPYEYEHPEGTGKSVPPFASIWFCGMTKKQAYFLQQNQSMQLNGKLIFHWDQLQSFGAVPTTKRLNPRQRKKRKQLESSLSFLSTQTPLYPSAKASKLTKSPSKKNKSHQINEIAINEKRKKGKKKKQSIYRDATSGKRKKKRF